MGTGCGVVMGMIPGVGECTAQFLGDTCAQKTNAAPDVFGTGPPAGPGASESADNAVPAAAMVPLPALGIPGEPLTAVMLS